MTWDSSNPSRSCSVYEGFFGAMSRAACTAVRAVSAAVLRCLRASARRSCASCISFLPGSVNVDAGFGGSEEASRLSDGWAL